MGGRRALARRRWKGNFRSAHPHPTPMTRPDHPPVTHLLDLLRPMEWADATIWREVLAVPAERAAPSMMGRLHHVHLVQRVFLQRWRQEPLTITPQDHFRDLPALARWGREYYPEAYATVAALDDAGLRREVPIPGAERLMPDGAITPPTVGETVVQVAMHTTHHRGQLLLQLRELNATPPLVDWIAWVLMGRPAPAWPAGAA